MQLEETWEDNSNNFKNQNLISEDYICLICKDNYQTKQYLENTFSNHSNSNLVRCLSCNKTLHDTCYCNLLSSSTKFNKNQIDQCPYCLLYNQGYCKSFLQGQRNTFLTNNNYQRTQSKHFQVQYYQQSKVQNSLKAIKIRYCCSFNLGYFILNSQTHISWIATNLFRDIHFGQTSDNFILMDNKFMYFKYIIVIILKQFEPLKLVCPLKFRKDQEISFNQIVFSSGNNSTLINQGLNSIQITDIEPDIQLKQESKCISKQLMVGIFYIKKLKSEQLFNSIMTQNILSKDQSLEFITNQFRSQSNDNLQIEKITIKLIDAFDYLKIQYPCRGSACQHVQCFNLKNFLGLEEKAQLRTWNCPICRNYIHKLIIDEYQQEILSKYENEEEINEIYFNQNGEYSAERKEKVQENSIENAELLELNPKKSLNLNNHYQRKLEQYESSESNNQKTICITEKQKEVVPFYDVYDSIIINQEDEHFYPENLLYVDLVLIKPKQTYISIQQ